MVKGNRPSLVSRIVPAVALLVGFGFVTQALATNISGMPRVVDGDTLEVAAVKIRLEGIDAPETDQVCLDQRSSKWSCGIAARDRLTEHIGNRSVDCTPTGSDNYRRSLAVCSLADENLNAWMVRQGWALAYTKYSKVYVPEEEQARHAQRG
jgi:endonuclease YncB( thermonuclease family)